MRELSAPVAVVHHSTTPPSSRSVQPGPVSTSRRRATAAATVCKYRRGGVNDRGVARQSACISEHFTVINHGVDGSRARVSGVDGAVRLASAAQCPHQDRRRWGNSGFFHSLEALTRRGCRRTVFVRGLGVHDTVGGSGSVGCNTGCSVSTLMVWKCWL